MTYTDYPYEGSEEYSYDEEYEEGEEEPEDKDTGDENLLSYMDENNGRNDDDILTLLNANKTQQ